MKYIEDICLLGKKLKSSADATSELKDIAKVAIDENPWFTYESIHEAIDNICDTMLKEQNLMNWANNYNINSIYPKNILIIAAGNIPLVCFFDILCVILSGHRCWIKLSSKDSVLPKFIISELKKINRNIPVDFYNGYEKPDAVIATGSNNTNRYFQAKYGTIPHIFRKSRYSVGILSGTETIDEIEKLQKDIISYFGMGCRNVSLLFLPENYNPENLNIPEIAINSKYRSLLKYHKAILKMNKVNHFDLGIYTLRKYTGESIRSLPDIQYINYSNISEVKQFLSFNRQYLQCIVTGKDIPGFARVNFGESQWPQLWDFPDNIDIMEFLNSI